MFKDVLKNKVNRTRFFNLVIAVGEELNSRKDRFDKSDLLENALANYSGGFISWVDSVGFDHQVGEFTSEMKTQKFCLYTEKAGKLKKKTKKIKLMNSLGDASNRSKQDVIKFDYLKIIDTGSINSFSVAFIHKDEIKEEWLDFSKDGVSLQIPTNRLIFVVKPDGLILESKKTTVSYKKEKTEAQRRYIESF